MAMRQRFKGLWDRLGGTIDADAEFQRLYDLYAQLHRCYHNLDHIRSCLVDFQAVLGLAENPDWLECAIWYHDVIYDVHRADNEQKSAEYTAAVCQKAGLSADAIQEIHDLILITKHDSPPKTINENIIVDIDLAVLGKPPQEYEQYARAIRKEYAHVSDADFQKGRSAVLHGFLDWPSIYSLDYFKNKYQRQAEKNIVRELAILS